MAVRAVAAEVVRDLAALERRTCGDASGTGPCSDRATGSCGCCDQGYFWGCKGSCGGTTYSVSVFEALVGNVQVNLILFGIEYAANPRYLAQIDIIKTSYSLTSAVTSDQDLMQSLTLEVLRTASGFIPPPYGIAIRVAWGAYDFITTYEETGNVWEASLTAISNNLEVGDVKYVGNLLANAAKASNKLNRRAQLSTRSINGNHSNPELRTEQPLMVKVTFFVNVTDEAHLTNVLNNVGEEKFFAESALDPVTYGFWDDTQTLTVGCLFQQCNPQILVEPSSSILLNVNFNYAAASSALTTTKRDTIRTVLANTAGPLSLQSHVTITSETSTSSSSTDMRVAISMKSKLYATKAAARMTASNLNSEAVKAALGTDLFSSITATTSFSNFTVTPLQVPEQTTTTTTTTSRVTTTTSAVETTPAPLNSGSSTETNPASDKGNTSSSTPSGSSQNTSSTTPSGSSQNTGSSTPSGSSQNMGSSTPSGSSQNMGSSTPSGSTQNTNSGDIKKTDSSSPLIIVVVVASTFSALSISVIAVVYIRKQRVKKIATVNKDSDSQAASVPDIPTAVTVVSCLEED
ncbi:hypothetical protein GUITHDRAFT_136926 [Guillardia theta CCMP2712]|uniref:Uncharacterized protein n=1 Tax=Guillardia theta (strain CCMP2712) TaxID=905079 RepID=L1JIH2_GUITC|nr:hypothetical protein GUITHDRAFT_136926 [Guillardia theta CCMP2712]EKX47954.1 hypothetical protein GUITHDRAFT_136926 [Guillardia theta CCMP2712]|eukprot:XP_005834934.1 hypothetical protein GUITHDRAFT_136926 [Guillardia theta CCMP2712]